VKPSRIVRRRSLSVVRRLPMSAGARIRDDACGQALDNARGRKPRSVPRRLWGLKCSRGPIDHALWAEAGAGLMPMKQRCRGPAYFARFATGGNLCLARCTQTSPAGARCRGADSRIEDTW
jgi:hypothetical protein